MVVLEYLVEYRGKGVNRGGSADGLEPSFAVITYDGVKLVDVLFEDGEGHQSLISEDVYFVFSEWCIIDVLTLVEILVIDLIAVYLIAFSHFILPLGDIVLPANHQHLLVGVLPVYVVICQLLSRGH